MARQGYSRSPALWLAQASKETHVTQVAASYNNSKDARTIVEIPMKLYSTSQ